MVEDQLQMRNKRDKERDKNKTKETSTYLSEIKCSKCQSRKHKSNECPNKRVLMLRAKTFCKEPKEVNFHSSPKEEERQDRYWPCVGKGSHSKNIWIQHKENKELKENAPKTIPLSFIK